MGPGFESLKVHQDLLVLIVSVISTEGPPVPIPNTEVKLCSAYNTWLATAREDWSMLTPQFLRKGCLEHPFFIRTVYPYMCVNDFFLLFTVIYTSVCVFCVKGPPVPIPNTEVKLCSAENTCLETDRKNRS